jgi:parallel beta-helix repeat protein
MYPKDDPGFLWVSPSGESTGDGTYEDPFCRIEASLARVLPGQTIVLMAGTYRGDVTVQVSGSIDKPLRIIADADADAQVIVGESCWYFYDVSDMILSGIVFQDSMLGSIVVMGKCERNRFEYLTFKNCCRSRKASCSLFFGGSGAACNIVEQCTFERPPQAASETDGKNPDDLAVGLMISEGDAHEGAPIIDHVIRKNRFVNYDYGILVGTDDDTEKQYGHQILHNSIDNCAFEGIMVKCGDTLVRGNTISNCRKNSISVVTGEGTTVEDNRILDSGLGIRVGGKAHTISNNCIVRCGEEAIRIMDRDEKNGPKTQNVIAEKNTCVAWSQSRPHEPYPAISIEPKAYEIVKKNLFLGPGKPCQVVGAQNNGANAICGHSRYCIFDNLSAAHHCDPGTGISCGQVVFEGIALDNYDNATGYGAKGWMVGPGPFDPDKEHDETIAACAESR